MTVNMTALLEGWKGEDEALEGRGVCPSFFP